MRKNLKIVSPFLIYCCVMFLFYFANLFKINSYKEFFEIIGMALFAGFFEELIFRHWLQQKISLCCFNCSDFIWHITYDKFNW